MTAEEEKKYHMLHKSILDRIRLHKDCIVAILPELVSSTMQAFCVLDCTHLISSYPRINKLA